jgi:hypothetical protein
VVWIEPFVAPVPTVAVTEPRMDESIPEPDAPGRRVVLEDGGYLAASPGARITVVLDGDGTRDVTNPNDPLTLRDLVPADRDVSLGEHVVVAVVAGPRGDVVRRPDGTPATSVRRFWVGPAATPRVDLEQPMVVFVVPRGTYNGEAEAASALLDFVVLGGSSDPRNLTVHARIDGPRGRGSTVLLGRAGPYAVRGLESGDYAFELALYQGGAKVDGAFATATRVITVNLDAPVARAGRK